MAAELGDAVHLRTPVEAILTDGERVVAVRVGGEERPVRAVVSTAPVHVLSRLVTGTEALRPLARFRYRPMVFVNLRFRGRHLLPDVVTWTPESGFPFFRLTEAPLSMPWLAPEGQTLVTADIGCEVGDAIWAMDDDALGEHVVQHLSPIIPGARAAYRGCRVLRTPIAYPVYLREYEAERRRMAEGLPVAGLHSIGRNGEFAHILMEDIYWRTLRRMQALVASLERAPGR
jgi:protoporphyrinogen oxidase